MALFSAARSTSAPIPEVDRRTSRGGGRAARGVSSWFWFRGLCFSVAAWCGEAPDGSSFSSFSRESPPRARRDRRPDLCDGFCRSAGLRPPEFHFGHFASCAWRLLVLRLSASKKKKVGFLDLPTAGFLRFLFCLLFLLFHSSPDPRGVLWDRSANSGIYVKLALIARRGGGRGRRLLRVIPADARTRTCSPCCVVVALGGATGTAHPRAGSAGRARPSRSLAHIQATQVARMASSRPPSLTGIPLSSSWITASYVSRNTTRS